MVNRSQYYSELKKLANEQRKLFKLSGPDIKRIDMRRIYKQYGISIDQWPMPGIRGKALKNLRGAYFHNLNGSPGVVVARIPDEPYIFTLAHELKHHLVDRDQAGAFCHTEITSDPIEIGAEIFAAEFIYPQADFERDLMTQGVIKGVCKAEDLVHLKQKTRASLSYAALSKRAQFTGFAREGSLPKSGWKKLEEQLYGEPVYKRINRYRKRRSSF